MSIAILGDQNSGKSVFLGLLYQTMIATNAVTDNSIRYTQNFYFANRLSKIVADMISGHWPACREDGDPNELRFLLGYNTEEMKMYDKKRHKMNKYMFRWEENCNFACHIAYILDISGETVAEFAHMMDYFETCELDSTLQEVFDSDIVVLLIDSSRFTESTGHNELNPLVEYDRRMAMTLATYIRYREEMGTPEVKRLYPIIFFTKLDAIETDVIKRFRNNYGLNIPELTDYIPGSYLPNQEDPFPGIVHYNNNKDAFQQLGVMLMSRYMFHTKTQLMDYDSYEGIDLPEPMFFYSWLNGFGNTEESDATEGDIDKDLNLKTYRDDFGLTNIFSQHMYQAFLYQLGTMFTEVIDPPEKYRELYETGKDLIL